MNHKSMTNSPALFENRLITKRHFFYFLEGMMMRITKLQNLIFWCTTSILGSFTFSRNFRYCRVFSCILKIPSHLTSFPSSCFQLSRSFSFWILASTVFPAFAASSSLCTALFALLLCSVDLSFWKYWRTRRII